ncbi:pyrroline-5-carboxylate reductase dimerization-domain-containing protein [Aspergillus unguis]
MSQTLCILGCGNLGTAILQSLLKSDPQLFTHYIACIKTPSSETRLKSQFPDTKNLTISTDDNINAIQKAGVVILALDPGLISTPQGLKQPGLAAALAGKVLISVVAGWTVQSLEEILYTEPPAESQKVHIVRTLPTIAAQVSQSLTAIEVDPSRPPASEHIHLTQKIFNKVGKTLVIPPSLIDATTAVAGSTPAMFAIIVDAMVDAAVAVGVPRQMATGMVVQAMKGSAEILDSGVTPAELRDQGTSPEGCTMGGVMVLEERGVRGGVGRAVREAVTVARQMGEGKHLNDTR